ncbi:CLUMA_CG013919, isoform A [Clunio marinus]|uniref:CLUMA_CG013919, isoform A n=1 Tax=Clunio marinus TaxID=568069 RepID=A0A1J1IK99_9DIPT|nr:CLUMA_CG013919, isoform A [Clunio marinus]
MLTGSYLRYTCFGVSYVDEDLEGPVMSTLSLGKKAAERKTRKRASEEAKQEMFSCFYILSRTSELYSEEAFEVDGKKGQETAIA